jgi:SagB-type dehydrogenase family enzyme
MVAEAPATVVIAAYFPRTTRRYGDRGVRYVYMEVGFAAQNLHLQAESLNLGTVAIGAFDDAATKRILGIEHDPLLLMPVGRRR